MIVEAVNPGSGSTTHSSHVQETAGITVCSNMHGDISILVALQVQKLVDLCKSYRRELKCIAQEVPSNTPPWTEQLVSPPEEKGEPLSTPWLNFEEATPQHNDNILEEVLLRLGGHHYDEASLLDFPTALAVSCCQPEDSSLAWYDGAENDTGVQFRPSGGTPCLTVTRRTPMKRKRKPTVLVRRMDASSSQITKPKGLQLPPLLSICHGSLLCLATP